MPRPEPYLPAAPAQVKVLVVPVGPMHRDRFASFLDRLKTERAISLHDVSADSRPNRTMFSPLAFPDGFIFYDLVTHVPPDAHRNASLSPFELHREPLVVLALADGAVLKTVDYGSKRHSSSAGARSVEERNVRALYQELEALRDTHTKALVHRVLIFDYGVGGEEASEKNEEATDSGGPPHMPDEGMATVPPVEQSKRTTIKTIMADVSSLLLAEMNTMARSLEALSYIESPGQTGGPSRGHGEGFGSDDSSMASRRNSHFPLSTRSGSLTTAADRAHARMSMPVPFKTGSPFGGGSSSNSAGSTPAVRPSTPVSHSDDMGSAGILSSPEKGGSHGDSIAVQGFGSGGLNERWRIKGKGRVTIVVASLYLQAGLWTDALKELIDGATVARSVNDHVWHGKALELIVVCLLLLAWADVEFQVPSVLLPPPEKGSAAQHAALALEAAAEKAHPEQAKWLRHLQLILPELLDRILGLYSRISAEHLPPLPLAEATLRFSSLLTALHMADGVVGRAFLDVVVEGKASDTVLTTSPRLTVTPSRAYITNMLFKAYPSLAAATTDTLPTVDRIVILSGIAAGLGRLGLQRKKSMVVRELLSVLISGLVDARTRGAAEVGIHPAAGLVSLNGVGGMGAGAGTQHSGHTNGAAALDLAEGDIESGVETFLGMLLKQYGVVELEPAVLPTAVASTEHIVDDSDEAIVARIGDQAAARLFGLPGNKFNLLRACINFCEALPDFAGVLKYSSDLLRTGGSGIAPGPTRGDAAAVLSRSEQVRLVTNIAKTSNLSRRLGFGEINAEYWDEFLVRGVKLEPAPAACQPVAHSKAELPVTTIAGGKAAAAHTSQDVDPFIHNSFLKPSAKAIVEPILVTDEPATFKLTLQNPYDIDVEIESIRIETQTEAAEETETETETTADGTDNAANNNTAAVAAFEAFADSTVLGPFRTQIVKVSGVPRAPGALRVTGAIVQVRGCRERRFPVFAEPWSPVRPDKVKHIGRVPFGEQQQQELAEKRASVPAEKRTSVPSDKRTSGPADKRISAPSDKRISTSTSSISLPPLPVPTQLALNVIPPQPMVVVEATTLPQSSVMVLEGERQVFSVTLKNLSTATPVDFLLFSFLDSTQAAVQTALARRDTSPAELYEYELVLAKKQALRLRTASASGGGNGAAAQRRRYIAPGDTATFEFEILGKPGLTSGTIQVDYAHLGVPIDDVASTFYTRQASLHLTVTVNASVDVARMDVLPLHGGIPEPLWERCGGGGGGSNGGGGLVSKKAKRRLSHDKYCLLLLDLRNAWPSQMRVELTADDGDGGDGDDGDTISVTEYILPGNTARVVVPMRRIYLDDPHASIPALNPLRQRQFVVSTGKISPDTERANREAFWYRERILDRLRGTWSTQEGGNPSTSSTTPRHGAIELRSVRLTPRMIEAVKVDEVGIELGIRRVVDDDDKKKNKNKKSRSSRILEVDAFAELVVRVTNRTAAPLYPTLRLMPALCHRPLNVALDYTRKLAWNGALQQTLPVLGARSSTEVRLGVTALCRGEFEVTASVEETRLPPAVTEEKPSEKHGRPRSNTETLLLDSVLGPRERRIWHSRNACHFVVVDRR